MDANFSPIYLLAHYVWQLLKTNTAMTETDYGGLVPVVPVSQVPELEQFNKPFLVYGYALIPTEFERDFCQRGSMSFAIYGTNFRDITKIVNILFTAFNREDRAAADVNEYTSTIPSFVGIRFGTIYIGFSEGPSPEETEGGRQSAIINVRFEYYVNYDVETRPVKILRYDSNGHPVTS